jgi:hypothetical protein
VNGRQLSHLRRHNQDPTDPQVVDFGDGIFRIEQTEPVYGPRGGYLGDRCVYWPDAYPTAQGALRAIRIVARGGNNPQPSIKVSIDTGKRLHQES